MRTAQSTIGEQSGQLAHGLGRVERRAVEAGFPYYGRMRLADNVPYQHALLKGFGVLVRPELGAWSRSPRILFFARLPAGG